MSSVKIKILGCGNILTSDEGVGIHVIKRLSELQLPKNIEIIDAGAGGIPILDLFKDSRKVIIVDAISTIDGEDGEVYRFTDRELLDKEMTSIAMHNLNLADVVRVGRIIQPELMPEEIVVFGIEVEREETFNVELSPKVKSSVPVVVEMILSEIKRMNEEMEQGARRKKAEIG